MTPGQAVMLEGVRQEKARFLLAFGTSGNVTAACRSAGIGNRTRVYEWLNDDAAFRESYQEASTQATELLEEEARRRAVDGVVRPVFQQGRQVGEVVEYSDSLLTLLLKAHAPEKYRERVDVRASGGGEVEDVLTEEQRRVIAAVYLGLPDGGGDAGSSVSAGQAVVTEVGDDGAAES